MSVSGKKRISTHFIHGVDKIEEKSQCSAVEYVVSTPTISSKNLIQSLAESIIAKY